MRMRLMIGAGLIALAGSGCGGDGSARTGLGEAGARAALLEYSDAFLDAEYDDACAILTKRAKQRFERIKPCPEALELARGLIDDEQLESLRDKTRNVKITVDGDRATVDSITGDPKDTTNLVRAGGRWFVDADSG